MEGHHVFISHASADDDVVRKLREALEGLGVDTWVDSRRLSGGDPLEESIRRQGIADAEHVLVVLSRETVNSSWVDDEVGWAHEVRRERGDGFKVIPVMLPGIKPTALRHGFGKEEVVGVPIGDGPAAVTDALPDLMAALGRRLPDDFEASFQPEPPLVAELVLRLADPAIVESEGKRRATATAFLVYQPPAKDEPTVESKRYRFTATLGAIERGEIEWYLERYCHWPSGVFQERARRVEKELPAWGRQLYDALVTETGREAFEPWKRAEDGVTRRLSVLVDADPVEGTPDAERAAAAEAATLLLALPWELTHDGKRYLFEGGRGVQVRRRLPHREQTPPLVTAAPIRVLLVSPRPEDDAAVYLDHRISARPLVDALTPLGELVELTLLAPPTFGALDAELRRARERGEPYDVVHFDGHGVYDKRHGLGGLCFEDPKDLGKLEKRGSQIVLADALAAKLQDHRVPLVFLEACQTAKSEQDIQASVAGRLLRSGVASVVAMSHSVLVETARRFVAAFYRELMAGRRIGDAVLVARNDLKDDTFRGKVFKGDLHLEDWFVPVLFQEELDPQLITEVPAERVRRIREEQRRLALGDLPEEPPHTFVGRSRELLKAERLLKDEGYAVFLGEGGEGKTTLAAELARWLVATRRFKRAAFVSMEQNGDARRMLFALGTQLVPGLTDPEQAMQHVERALSDQPTVIVIDNMESVLPSPEGSPEPFEPKVLEELLKLWETLTREPSTRLIFTSRTALPSPFAGNVVPIGRLERREAIELVGKVLGEGNRMPYTGEDESEEEIEKLVDAVNCHARSLTLLAAEVVASGVRNATESLHELMASLAERYPDDRERSLFASVELSLRRLPEETRRVIRPLGVSQGGGHLAIIAAVLGLGNSPDAAEPVAQQLIGVGLADMMPYGYLRFHPALGPLLLREMSVEEQERVRGVWSGAVAQLVDFLYQQGNEDPQLAATLTLLELPNLLAGLEHLHETVDAERVVGVATSIEGLLERLGRPKALARAVEIREVASRQLGEWSHARFQSESAAVDRLLDAGRCAEAVEAAQKVLQRSEAAGEDAFEGAAYDLAMAHIRLGRALQMGGAAEAALAPLGEARGRFQKLAVAGSKDAARMASASLTEAGDCLTNLGRLDEAADTYEAAIQLDTVRNDLRDVAVGKGQLGTVRMLQKKYEEALAAHTEAREIFERLGEPGTVAVAWHQIGMVHEEARQYESAEHAYQQSLKIKVQRGNRQGEASTLNQLGNLYGLMERLEEAVSFYRQAAEIFVELKDLMNEGRTRGNAAERLFRLNRYDEARQEILRNIKCFEPFSHAAEPWKSFEILFDLERAVGNDAAAAEARGRAVQAYLAYRRAGGENQSGRVSPQLCAATAQAVTTDQTEAAASQLAELSQRPDLPAYLRPLIPALNAILNGSRDPALASDPELSYVDAAEILLLLERLGADASGRPAESPE